MRVSLAISCAAKGAHALSTHVPTPLNWTSSVCIFQLIRDEQTQLNWRVPVYLSLGLLANWIPNSPSSAHTQHLSSMCTLDMRCRRAAPKALSIAMRSIGKYLTARVPQLQLYTTNTHTRRRAYTNNHLKLTAEWFNELNFAPSDEINMGSREVTQMSRLNSNISNALLHSAEQPLN
jgi:hypothetical protein